MKKILDKKLIILGVIIILAISGIAIYQATRVTKDINTGLIEELDPLKMDKELRDKWLENKAINPDYVGEIVFDSGLINLSFVQAESIYDDNGHYYKFYDISGREIKEESKDFGCDDGPCTGNDVYLWTYWKTGEYDKMDNGGSIFMDYRNNLSDENIIIYGHHFSPPYDPSRTRAFTPLELLMEEENYEANKKLSLILDNEIREYEIAVVFEYSVLDDDEPQYYRTSYNYTIEGYEDEGYKEKYFEEINKQAYYETGVALRPDDKTLTLQTCYSNRPDYRLVIVCKEVGRIQYQ